MSASGGTTSTTERVAKFLRQNAIGLVALFIALSAGAYAAGLPKNSVSSKQIKAGAVKGSDLANGAVASPKVADGSLLSSDFAAGQLPAGQRGPQGPQGETGPPGSLTGPAGGDLTGNYPNPTLGSLPMVRVARTTASQAIVDNTETPITFTTEISDNAGMFNPTTTQGAITIQRAGTYVLSGGARWAANATGTRTLTLRVGASRDLTASTVNAVGGGEVTRQSVSAVAHLSAGDAITLQAFQDSGGNLTVGPSSELTSLAAAWIGP